MKVLYNPCKFMDLYGGFVSLDTQIPVSSYMSLNHQTNSSTSAVKIATYNFINYTA